MPAQALALQQAQLQQAQRATLDAIAQRNTLMAYGKVALASGVLGAVVGSLMGATLKGALIGAIGGPIVVAGGAALAMRGMT